MSKANEYIMANIGYIRVSSIQQITDRQLEGVVLDKIFTDKASEPPRVSWRVFYLWTQAARSSFPMEA